jgi:hypothetical protein
MVSVITSDIEGKRYINYQLIPQNITSEIKTAFRKQERTAGQIRKSNFNFSALSNRVSIKYCLQGNLFFYPHAFYEGSYIEPPDNV